MTAHKAGRARGPLGCTPSSRLLIANSCESLKRRSRSKATCRPIGFPSNALRPPFVTSKVLSYSASPSLNHSGACANALLSSRWVNSWKTTGKACSPASTFIVM